VEEIRFSAERDVPKLTALAERGVYIGTSSWNYPGWVGQVYLGDYSGPRKSFVKSRFEAANLHDVSRVFPTVCFDGGYWRLPDDAQMQKYANDLPENYQFAIKVTDLLTQRRFNQGPSKGEMNGDYLSPDVFKQHFLPPVVNAFGETLGPIIFEFTPFHFGKSFGIKDGYTPLAFVKDLHQFLDRIPKGKYKYCVEVRDPEIIDPSFGRYIDCLEYHGVAHVLNEQTWMPPVGEQLQIPGIMPAEYTVFRALTKQGRSHEAAVKAYEPYDRLQEPDEAFRRSFAGLIDYSLKMGRKLYAYVNNRREGNAPDTIANVLHLFEQMQTP
jgi:uncharacterized protein YecE (DUF72 family)